MKYLILTLWITSSLYAQNVKITPELIKRLKQTTPTNMDQIVHDLGLKKHKRHPRAYKIANPYKPMTRVNSDDVTLPPAINGQTAYKDHEDGTVSFYHQQRVYEWYNLKSDEERNREVCGVKFTNQSKSKYHMKSFSNEADAIRSGYIVTHQFHCGACSSLHDLAIYLEKRNMVNDGRKCAKKFIPKVSKKCHIKRIGLSEYCAEVWAYNAMATRQRCMKTCIKEYGLFNMLFNKFPDIYVNPDGSLKPCILCDELKSGGGYRYGSGRTRRSSGIISAIDRGDEEVYPIDFKNYYQAFNLDIPQ
jgi:hypothetical protein